MQCALTPFHHHSDTDWTVPLSNTSARMSATTSDSFKDRLSAVASAQEAIGARPRTSVMATDAPAVPTHTLDSEDEDIVSPKATLLAS